jgi:hypothetical protein
MTTGAANGRDTKSGRFLPGHRGSGGRPVGSRVKLSERFLSDLHRKWVKHGSAALDRLIATDPATFVKVVSKTLPREFNAEVVNVNLSLFAECRSFAEAFRLARDHIGADAPRLINGDADDAE